MPAGRPVGSTKLKTDDTTLERVTELAKMQCILDEAASVLNVCPRTFDNYLRYSKKAREAWENGRLEGKVELRRLQFESAEHSVLMQIWLGKQYLGQRDKQEQPGPDGGPIKKAVQYIVTGVPRN